MLDQLSELLAGKLTADILAIIMLGIVALVFIVALIIGLVSGEFNQIKGVMKSAVAKPSGANIALKLPPALKSQYKAARLSNIKPSSVVSRSACVDEPYDHAVISKLWLVTFVATVVCGFSAFFVMPFAKEGGETGLYLAPLIVLLVGGLLTLIGGIIGKCVYGGATKLYAKFMAVIDGDTRAAESSSVYEPSPQNDTFAHAHAEQPAYEAQAEYEPTQPVYDEQPAQPVYEQPQQSYAEIRTEPQQPESDADFRKRAREEALARARAQQAQAQAQATQQQPQQQSAAATPDVGGSSTADEVIERINQIERDGAPRDVMREVATQLQKERAKPENKTPERVKQLNDALSRLLKAMSGARK